MMMPDVPIGLSMPDDTPLSDGWTHEQMRAMQAGAIGELIRANETASAKSRTWTDGKLRVSPKQDVKVMSGHSMLSFRASDVIEDPFLIGLLDANGIEYDVLSSLEPAVAVVKRRGRPPKE